MVMGMAKIDVVAVKTAIKNGDLKIVAEKGFFFMEDTKSGERVRLNEAFTVCKDCKMWIRNGGFAKGPTGHCFCHDIVTTVYDFCSYGERREGE
jgi:hypothetical protein